MIKERLYYVFYLFMYFVCICITGFITVGLEVKRKNYMSKLISLIICYMIN